MLNCGRWWSVCSDWQYAGAVVCIYVYTVSSQFNEDAWTLSHGDTEWVESVLMIGIADIPSRPQ